jgi:hypothetical protein
MSYLLQKLHPANQTSLHASLFLSSYLLGHDLLSHRLLGSLGLGSGLLQGLAQLEASLDLHTIDRAVVSCSGLNEVTKQEARE